MAAATGEVSALPAAARASSTEAATRAAWTAAARAGSREAATSYPRCFDSWRPEPGLIRTAAASAEVATAAVRAAAAMGTASRVGSRDSREG